MYHIKCVIFLLVTLLLPYATQPVSALEIPIDGFEQTTPHFRSATAQQIASIALKSTVLIETESSLGSGFVVGEGQVATNYHVIEGMASGTAQLVGGTTKYTVEGVLARDIPRDLTIIKVSGLSAPVLPLGDSDTLAIGQDVYAVGNPRGLTGTFSDGIISAIRPEGNSLVAGTVIQITAPISPGSSGGPVLNSDAEVIGIAVGYHTAGQNLNFAIPVNYLEDLLEGIEDGTVLPPITITEPTDGFIIWTDYGTRRIQRANLDGSNVQTLVTRGLQNPNGIAVDVAAGKMYWTDSGTESIQRANLDGSNIETLVTRGLENPADIALDVTGGKMYWTNQGEFDLDARDGKIQRSNLDGSHVETVVSRGLGLPEGIALAVAGGKMYWADWGTQRIQRANLDGSQMETVVSGGLPNGIAVDVAAGKMYWTDFGTESIQRANLDGSNIETLVTRGLENPSGIALDVAAGKMYWTDLGEIGSGARFGKEKIQRANLDGSNIETLVTRAEGLNSVAHIAVGVTSSPPQIVQQPDLIVDQSTVSKSTLAPGETFTLSTAVRNNGAGNAAATTLSYYRSTNSTITTSDTQVGTDSVSALAANGRSAESTSLTAPTSAGTYYYGACVDSVANESDKTNNCSAAVRVTVIVKAKDPSLRASTSSPLTEGMLDGSEVTLTLKDGAYEPVLSAIRNAITVSGISGVTVGSVRRVSDTKVTVTLAFDGTDFDTNATLTFSVGAGAIASYSGSSLTANLPVTAIREQQPLAIYWIDRGTDSIRAASLDASRVETLVQHGLQQPSGLALDVTGGHMYWTDSGTDKIQRADLDGSNVQDLVAQGLKGTANIALDVAGGKMYWTDNGADKIQRADLDGSNVQDLVTRGLRIPIGLELDVAGGKMYWTDNGTDKIQRADLDGSNVEDLVTGLEYPNGIVLDIAGGKMYWTEVGANKIQRADLDGSNVEDLITGLAGVHSIALDTTSSKMYWTDWRDETVTRANLDGSNVEAVLTRGMDSPSSIAINASPQPIVSTDPDDENGDDTVAVQDEDANRDGSVDVQDIVYVAERYGQTGQSDADINGDGVVNIDDIILVAAVVDSVSAAPAARAQLPKSLTAATVNQWLTEAKLLGKNTPTYQRGIRTLEQLLAALTPEDTALLPNYPNPFNPETWIPYRLANDTDVSLSIYDIDGVLVRELNLGHQRAGHYTDRSRAAYWDGRNAVGESVASGVYFYQLRAGDYTALRRMVILK